MMVKIDRNFFLILIALAALGLAAFFIFIIINSQSDQSAKGGQSAKPLDGMIGAIDEDLSVKSNTEKILDCEDCNIIIISLTNTRKDHISLYGYERDTTPNIDYFFKDSLIFQNAFAPTSWTLPNAATFFTSLFPYAHKVLQRNNGERIEENISTFSEILKQNGYAAAAFTGDGDYNRKFGFDQGFDLYLDRENFADYDIKLHDGGAGDPLGAYTPIPFVLPTAEKWLEQNASKKFFLFLQGFDTHCPFAPDEELDKKFTSGLKSSADFSKCLWTFDRTDPVYENGKKYWTVQLSGDPNANVRISEEDLDYMIALYDGKIFKADFYLKAFLDQIKNLGLEKNTIVVFMSEHGDLFGEHGRFMRGGPLRGTFYDPVINFPLLIKHPRIDKKTVVDDLVQMVDLMPTLLNSLDITDPQEKIRQGKALQFSTFGDPPINEYAYSGSKYVANGGFFSGTTNIEAIRSREWKLVRETFLDDAPERQSASSLYELYNIKEDPLEINNLYDAKKEIANLLEKNLDNFFSKISKR